MDRMPYAEAVERVVTEAEKWSMLKYRGPGVQETREDMYARALRDSGWTIEELDAEAERRLREAVERFKARKGRGAQSGNRPSEEPTRG